MFREVVFVEFVCYVVGDRIEKWLNDLLCFDAVDVLMLFIYVLFLFSVCEFYEVLCDILFSVYVVSE